jgi:phage terminase large subunit
MGVDVARFGDDQSVICLRQGRDAESQGWHTFRGMDTMELSARVVEIARAKNPDTVFIDGGGVGGGVVDRCRQLGLDVVEINFGSKATQRGYANLRAQMWGNLKQAIIDGIRLPDNPDLITDLTGIEYGYTLKNEIKLESKEAAKSRGVSSPDLADALALTYVLPVYPSRIGFAGTQHHTASEYEPL